MEEEEGVERAARKGKKKGERGRGGARERPRGGTIYVSEGRGFGPAIG